jgi:hypothetical protein
VGITLDTFNDQRRAYEFMVNPLGVQTDGIYSEGKGFGGGFDRAWDAIWTSEGRLTEDGYECGFRRKGTPIPRERGHLVFGAEREPVLMKCPL